MNVEKAKQLISSELNQLQNLKENYENQITELNKRIQEVNLEIELREQILFPKEVNEQYPI